MLIYITRVEDTGYVIAQSIINALGDKKGIKRYGFFYVPMDECLLGVLLIFQAGQNLC